MSLQLLCHCPDHVTWLTQGAEMCRLQRAQKQELWTWVGNVGFTESFTEWMLWAEH